MTDEPTDIAAIICGCVFRRERPVGLVVRDPEGDWQFLCGVVDHAGDDPPDAGVVGVRQAVLHFQLPPDSTGLEPGQTACLEPSTGRWEGF